MKLIKAHRYKFRNGSVVWTANRDKTTLYNNSVDKNCVETTPFRLELRSGAGLLGEINGTGKHEAG